MTTKANHITPHSVRYRTRWFDHIYKYFVKFGQVRLILAWSLLGEVVIGRNFKSELETKLKFSDFKYVRIHRVHKSLATCLRIIVFSPLPPVYVWKRKRDAHRWTEKSTLSTRFRIFVVVIIIVVITVHNHSTVDSFYTSRTGTTQHIYVNTNYNLYI